MAKSETESGEQRPAGVLVHDADLVAMNAISKAMKPLTQGLREEVVEWFKRKYDPATRPAPERE